jgi:hypothetical protein
LLIIFFLKKNVNVQLIQADTLIALNQKISFIIVFKKNKKFTYLACSIINISINTHEIHKCPRGEIGRHKGLKILAACGVPVRVWPRAQIGDQTSNNF